MPVTQLIPNGNGSFNVWTNIGGASKAASTSPPDDADSTYITLTGLTGSSTQTLTMTDLPTAAFVVESHVLTGRIRRASTGVTTNVALLLANGGGANTTPGTAAQPTTSYVDRTETNLAIPGGLALNPANVNACEAGVKNSGAGGNEEERCTTLKWDVTWHAAPGGFGFLIVELLGPLVLGSSLLMRDVWRMAEALARCDRPTILTGPEVAVLFRELVENPHRRFCFLG